MSLSKKDFIALADMLKTARMNYHIAGDVATYTNGYNPFKDEHLQFLADFCQSQNPRFKRDRWLSYIAGECGKNGGKVRAA